MSLLSTVIEGMSLEQIQQQLRTISGLPLRCKDDAAYRRELWRQLDRLVRQTLYGKIMSNIPSVRNAMAVTIGTATIGYVAEHDGSFFAFDPNQELIGEYETRREAMRAIPKTVQLRGRAPLGRKAS